ncbi:MAG: GreA/GreB family elongation factor, partial [Alphaproteobacteria bacterium]|nr:GreA/GreB family elongation factor [Alphaproteobacteria bacterium]
PPPNSNHDLVQFGAFVMVRDDRGQEKRYQLVGELEADIASGSLSTASPIGRALLGKKIGDMVEVITPSGEKNYEILNVHY